MQSRVWYAHTLVVPEKRESKVNESAVAAAARLALESTPPVSHSLQRRRRPRRFLELGLLATSAVLLFLVWRQYAGEPGVSGDAVAVAASNTREDIPAVLETGTVQRAVEQVPAEVAGEATLPPADATVPALQEAEPAAGQPRVAGFTALGADLEEAETYGEAADLPASEFATAPGASGAGELSPVHAGSEIAAIEVGEDSRQPETEAVETARRSPPSVVSNARSKPPASSGRSANQTKPKKRKQSSQVNDSGECSMPHWAWRAFGFTEEKRKRPC